MSGPCWGRLRGTAEHDLAHAQEIADPASVRGAIQRADEFRVAAAGCQPSRQRFAGSHDIDRLPERRDDLRSGRRQFAGMRRAAYRPAAFRSHRSSCRRAYPSVLPCFSSCSVLRPRLTPASSSSRYASVAGRGKSITAVGERVRPQSTGLVRADEALADRTRFGLDADRWKAFLEALDAPPRELPRLDRLLQEPSVFDRGHTQ